MGTADVVAVRKRATTAEMSWAMCLAITVVPCCGKAGTHANHLVW